MSNRWVVFACGLALGYVIHMAYFTPPPVAIIGPHCEPAAVAEGIPARTAAAPGHHEEISVRKLTIRALPDTISETAPRSVRPPAQERAEPESTAFLSIDEKSVDEMERSKDELKNRVYTEATGEGWRVHVLREDNLLTQTGIQDGDLITTQSLNMQLQQPDRVRLASRIMRILNDLNRQ